jgi:AAA15 family ATPase/GTPase
MLSKITIKNFKRLEQITFELSQSVVLIGPNNAGKSTIFQALCLWEIGVRSFLQADRKGDLDRKGHVVINRKDLLNSPISDARFLWKDKKVTEKHNQNGQPVSHIRLEIILEGESEGKFWLGKAEFIFANAESLTCRITAGLQELKNVFNEKNGVHFGFLQTMSGISVAEDKLPSGSIERRLGEGKTAEVLRNICHEVIFPENSSVTKEQTQRNWTNLTNVIKEMYGAVLHEPEYIRATGLILLEYTENKIRYDISSAGRGFQQTLLLLAYMYAHPNTILLLDEPDAHLEVIRQREIFYNLTKIANITNSQLIIASHSEVILNQAAEKSKIIALIEDNAIELTSAQSITQFRKSLIEIGWEKYYLARLRRHVIYVEGTSDFEMIKAFATRLKHPVESLLRQANVDYVSQNKPTLAESNFHGLREIFPELKGIAIFDRLPKTPTPNPHLPILSWKRRELENYLALPYALVNYAKLLNEKFPIFSISQLEDAMNETIKDYTIPAYLKNLSDTWWNDVKISDDWLDKIFPTFFQKLGLPVELLKKDYHLLIPLLKDEDIDVEITEKLDAIYNIIK